MYGLSEAQSRRAMVQINPSQISFAVALAASIHLATIALTTLEFYIEVPPLDTIYLKLVAEGDGAALSASEPTFKLSSSITLPAMASQARPTTDLLAGTLISELEEATKQNKLVVNENGPNNVPTPTSLIPIASPKSASEKRNMELAPSDAPKAVSASATAVDDVTMLQTPPVLSLMSSPQTTTRQSANQTPINLVRGILIEPARLDIPAPTPNSSHPSWLDTSVASVRALTVLTKYPQPIGKLLAPLDVIPALFFSKGPSAAPPSIINVEEQNRLS